jgi:hypothetical protein
VGLATAGGLAEIAAGVLGTVATWVASTGSRAAGRVAQTPRLVGACVKQARGFLGGALRCAARPCAAPHDESDCARPCLCLVPHLTTRVAVLGLVPHLTTRVTVLGLVPHLTTRVAVLGLVLHLTTRVAAIGITSHYVLLSVIDSMPHGNAAPLIALPSCSADLSVHGGLQ